MAQKRLQVIFNLFIVMLFLGSIISGSCSIKHFAPEDSSSIETVPLPYAGQELVLSGSTTLLQVSEAWAAAFMKGFGGTIIVNGGGSGSGIADLINGISHMANYSREIKAKEIEEAKKVGLDISEFTVLFDGLAIIVSDNVTVEDLTIKQLSNIYTGSMTNWKDFGGEDAEIVIISRDSTSGTAVYFLEEVVQLKKTAEENDYSELALRLQSNAEIISVIKEYSNAISYVGLGYLDSSLKSVKVEGVIASVENVKEDRYPISRGLYVYTSGEELTEIGKAYLDFIISDEGQAIGIGQGFVPID